MPTRDLSMQRFFLLDILQSCSQGLDPSKKKKKNVYNGSQIYNKSQSAIGRVLGTINQTVPTIIIITKRLQSNFF